MSEPENIKPELPDELWSNLSPPPFVPFVCYTSEASARTFAQRAGLESRLVGVNPSWRERALAAEAERDRYHEIALRMLPSRHRQRHLMNALEARRELADLKAAAKLAIEETIRRPMGVVPDSAHACLKMIGEGK